MTTFSRCIQFIYLHYRKEAGKRNFSNPDKKTERKSLSMIPALRLSSFLKMRLALKTIHYRSHLLLHNIPRNDLLSDQLIIAAASLFLKTLFPRVW
ncbi:hypothetical protein [Parageobacillus thermoglucosidasius]|uniref:hypothetical protein n=1 Tax=Parageobacillus thermoglucosidasius TaxID=1426 RepID=UPI0027FC8C65|nr:hypothetical protein PthstB1num2_28030 [Parageobacillus thermoglucosidasius]